MGDVHAQLELMLHPIRLRIVQFILLKKEATAREVGEELSDIPKASLYRHLRKLLEGDVLCTVRENRIRGTLEKVYGVTQHYRENPKTMGELREGVYAFMMALLKDFERYFRRAGKNDPIPENDMLLLQAATLNLSDREFEEFLKEIGEVYGRAMANKLTGERRMRRMTLISSPVVEEEKR